MLSRVVSLPLAHSRSTRPSEAAVPVNNGSDLHLSALNQESIDDSNIDKCYQANKYERRQMLIAG